MPQRPSTFWLVLARSHTKFGVEGDSGDGVNKVIDMEIEIKWSLSESILSVGETKLETQVRVHSWAVTVPVCALVAVSFCIVANSSMVETDFQRITKGEDFDLVIKFDKIFCVVWLGNENRFGTGVSAVGGDVREESKSN